MERLPVYQADAQNLSDANGRSAARSAKFVSNETGSEKFLLNLLCPDGPPRDRFSPAADVVTFCGLIHLATRPNTSLEAFK